MVKERPPLEEMTLRQLRRVASEYGISRYSRMRKSQLLASIQEIERTKLSVNPSRNLEAQEEVEAAKFELGQEDRMSGELSSVDEGLADLPAGYGETRIVLMPRDPQWAYTYWDIPNDHKEELRRLGGQQLALRLYDVTDINIEFQRPHSIQEYPCDELAREWYLPIPVSDRHYVVDIGYRCADGRWLVLGRSARVHVPPVYPSDWIEDHFISVAWEEDLRGKTVLELVAPGSKVASGPVYEQVFGMAQEAEAARVAGSVFGSMPHVPGSVAPGSAQMVTGSGQMVTGSGQMVTGSGQMVTGSGQMVTGSGQMVTGSGQMVTGSGQMVTGSGQMVMGSGQMVTGSGQMVMGSGQMVMGSGQMVTGSGQMVMGSGQMIPGSMHMIPGSGQMVMGSGQMVTGSGQMVMGSGQMVMGSGQMIPGSMHMIPGSGQMVTGSGQMITGSGHMITGSGHMMSEQSLSSYVFASGIGMWGVPTMSGINMSGVGFSASAPPIRPREFWLIADAELIIYGATEPDATVTIGGSPIKLNADGTFRFQMSFQDGVIDYPIMAVAADGEQTRSIHMKFTRETPSRNTNTKDEAVLEWLS
ncbi:DUF4912 domain-containing protein [Ancylothrix sp. D3o]|uniref:DUF4912 domain-containing protein n=1 Tax=Ancylothrix sp. D3o TaxID=2953691 RepID=UPI00294FFD4A|nr:DUF4912 domain-containing protein [Ancylothrix sp. D3o]